MSANHFVPYSLLVAAIGLAGTAIAARAGAGLVDARPTGAETASFISSSPSGPSPAPLAGFSPTGTDVPDEKESHRALRSRQAIVPLLANNQILAFYGSPLSRNMGILGEYPKEELAPILLDYARRYNESNGRAGIVPAFYIIYGTCWPEGEIGYLPD
ncbi:MAG: hypothetical protein Q8M76_06655, partial [Spirochaetaceae bacterium]|nr:hypothetical protein [Spirochaetaceae bacterium]